MKVFALTLLMTLTVIAVTSPSELNVTEPQWNLAGSHFIHNAKYMEKTPEFTDLYVIETFDKGRQITIYCNSSACYKQTRHGLLV